MRTITLGELKRKVPAPHHFRSVRDEIRENLIRKLQEKEPLFPGIVGYDDSVIPALVNALLSRHNLILLGLRGQAKSRILRALTNFLDEFIPCVEGCEIHDDPFFPICATCRRRRAELGEDLPVVFVGREERYVEKLATPDVTIADIIGDLDPIKAARKGRDLAAHENIHFGLLPRAHRGIFALNELPDLAPKIQVGLFNVMQEGDVQIKGFPIRLPLDVLLAFSANPEDYTARGKIITPLKDRIGSEIKTHYPRELEDGISITRQESWTQRNSGREVQIPPFIWEIVERVAFRGRRDKRVDHRSGVSQRLPITCLENALSNAERRALAAGERMIVLRVADVYAALPSITGKLELEYEGELKGADQVAKDLIQGAVRETFRQHFPEESFEAILQWFNLGGSIQVSDQTPSREYLNRLREIQGIEEILSQQQVKLKAEPEKAVSLLEFVLEGLCSEKKLSRSEEKGYHREVEALGEEFFDDRQGRRRSLN